MIAILLADGFEELEALTPVDVLRRELTNKSTVTVGMTGKTVTGAHGIRVEADITAEELDPSELEAAIFPGGMPGATNLDALPLTDKIIKSVTENGGVLGAICAAPLVFGRRGLLQGKEATCFPGFESELKGATVLDRNVVRCGSIITARNFRESFEFADTLVSVIKELDSNKGAEQDSSSENGDGAVRLGARCIFEAVRRVDDITESAVVPASEATAKTPEEEQTPEVKGNADCKAWQPPSVCNLKAAPEVSREAAAAETEYMKKRLVSIIDSMGIPFSIRGVDRGPRFTRFEIKPAMPNHINRIAKNAGYISHELNAHGMRIEAPIPGKAAVAIELPNPTQSTVSLRELLESDQYKNAESDTFVCLGKNVSGEPVFGDVAKFPHILIAGAPGMGKSTAISSIITSILFRARPDRVKFIMIDPRQVKLKRFASIPHLLVPIIHDATQGAAALRWAVDEMERRYDLLARLNVRNIDAYNERVLTNPSVGGYMPKLIIVIDELADLMMQARDPAEDCIMRIAQKARAAGIHLIIGTQRPDVKVITGTIKANINTRLSCKVTSAVDSRTILEMAGAEKLLNRGDMLYKPASSPRPFRIQGAYMSEDEIEVAVDEIKQGTPTRYSEDVHAEIDGVAEKIRKKNNPTDTEDENDSTIRFYCRDQHFLDAVELVIRLGSVTTAILQRKLSIGYSRAAKFIGCMETLGVVSPLSSRGSRKAIIDLDAWYEKLSKIDTD